MILHQPARLGVRCMAFDSPAVQAAGVHGTLNGRAPVRKVVRAVGKAAALSAASAKTRVGGIALRFVGGEMNMACNDRAARKESGEPIRRVDCPRRSVVVDELRSVAGEGHVPAADCSASSALEPRPRRLTVGTTMSSGARVQRAVRVGDGIETSHAPVGHAWRREGPIRGDGQPCRRPFVK